MLTPTCNSDRARTASDQRRKVQKTPGDRRTDPRLSFTAGVTAVEPCSQTELESHTSDVSGDGCFVDTMSPLPAGTEIHLRLTKNGRSFHTKARVIYCQVGVGMGLLFTEFAPAQRSVLERWFAELRGELPPAPLFVEKNDRPTCQTPPRIDERPIVEDLVLLLAQKHLLTEDESESILRRLKED